MSISSNFQLTGTPLPTNYRMLITTSPFAITGTTMTVIPWLSFTVDAWVHYVITLTLFYNVNATTEWIGVSFSPTPVLNNYSFVGRFSSTATAEYQRYYAVQNQNFATAQTSRVNNNRAYIRAEWTATSSGTLNILARSETASWTVTILPWTRVIIEAL